MRPPRHFLVFDTGSSGHHLQYLRQLTRYWVESRCDGRLDLALPRSFFERHAAFNAELKSYASRNVAALPLDFEPADVEDGGFATLVLNDLRSGRALLRIIHRRRPTDCVVMHLDHLQLSMGSTLRRARGVAFAGILFRANYHYADQSPGLLRRKRLTLRFAATNPGLRRVLVLDPAAPHSMDFLPAHVHVQHLPDGIDWTIEHDDTFAERLIQQDSGSRKTLLMIGGIDARKGVFQVMDALGLLGPELRHAVRLLLVGHVSLAEKAGILAAVARLRASGVEVVLHDAFIDESQFQPIIERSDLVLLTYQHHVGSSGILIRAAAAQTPVLGSDYGMVGRMIDGWKLGYSADTTNPEVIAERISAFLTDPAGMTFDAERALSFASENAAEAFGRVLFDQP